MGWVRAGPHPNPLPQAGEGADRALWNVPFPQGLTARAGPHPNPLPQAGEGADRALLAARSGTFPLPQGEG